MIPITPIPVSLFGAPLPAASPSPAVTSAANSFIPAISPPSGAAPASAPFADLLTDAVGQVEKLEKQARTSIEGLISGKGVDIHRAMIDAQKAGMGFELVLSVRNKALAAYQQVLGMQF